MIFIKVFILSSFWLVMIEEKFRPEKLMAYLRIVIKIFK